METTITGLFSDPTAARHATRELEHAGFPPAAITVLNRDTANLHQVLEEETSDAARGAFVGALVGGVGMAIAAAAVAIWMFHTPWPLPMLFGALGGGGGGALLGYLIGSATGHQVQQEYEHRIERGGQLVAVNTDVEHMTAAYETLQRVGGQALSTSMHGKTHVRSV